MPIDNPRDGGQFTLNKKLFLPLIAVVDMFKKNYTMDRGGSAFKNEKEERIIKSLKKNTKTGHLNIFFF